MDLEAVRSSSRRAVMELETLEFSRYWGAIQATDWFANDCDIVPVPAPSLSINGVDLTPLIKSLEVKRPLNGKSSLAFTLSLPTDEDGLVITPSDLCPPGSGDFEGLIRRHNRTTSRLLTLSIAVAGESRQFYFLPTAPRFDGVSLSWGGEDVVALAEADGQVEDDIIADTGDNVTAHQSIKSDASAVGLSVSCKFKDYRINELRKGSGNRISWMDRAAKCYQAARRTEGLTLIYQKLPNVLNGAGLPSARWNFVDRFNLQTVQVQQLEAPRNRFSAVRIKSIATVLEDPKSCSGNACIGRRRIDLATPTKGPIQIQVTKVEQGSIGDFVFFGKDDAVLLGPNTGVYNLDTPCAYFEFTYIPRISNFAYTPYFELYIRGGSPVGSATTVQEGFDASAEDDNSIDDVGLNPEFANLEDPIFFSASTAQDTVDSHLNASILRAWSGTFETPYLNPLIDPGDVVSVTDYLTRQGGRKWLVDVVSLRWDNWWNMSLECVRPTHG